MTTTANDVIAGILRQMSSVTPGEAIDGTEASNALVVINRMLAAFSMEWGLLQDVTLESFPCILGKGTIANPYTIGIGGDLNTVRPDTIFNQWIYDTVALIKYPLRQITDNQNRSITLDNIPSIPKTLYYDQQYPLGKIYLFPIAAATTYSIYLESYKPMAQFASLTSTLNLPEEYFEELVMLGTDELAPEYGWELTQRQIQKIDRTRDLMKARNFKRSVATFDPAINGSGRIPGGTILDGFIS